MNTLNVRIDLDQRRAIHRQITETLREKILSGEIAPGERIPSTHELAKTWKVNVATVHQALAALTREGLLERVKTGTHVRNIGNRLATVGIYSDASIWNDAAKENDFGRSVHRCLSGILTDNNIREELFLDTRSGNDLHFMLPELDNAARHHAIQGLITLGTDMRQAKWIPGLPVPVTGLGSSMPSNVRYLIGRFAEMAVAELAANGCRSIGVITPFIAKYADFYEPLKSAAEKHGIELRSEWMHVPTECVTDQERYGYDRFCALWEQKERPAGLLVYPDNAARGVITAILQKRIEIPTELSLVLHRNAELPYICPFTATFLESSCSVIARTLWEQVMKLHRGEDAPPAALEYTAVRDDGSAAKNTAIRSS